MKTRFLLSSLTVALACTLGLAPLRAADKDPETELGKQMDKMGGPFRALRRQANDATKNADSLTKVATLKAAAEASLKHEPAYKAKQPAAEQAKFVANYQAKMKEFIGNIAKLEAAFKANDNAAAAKLVEQLAADQKAGHTDFRPPPKKKA